MASLGRRLIILLVSLSLTVNFSMSPSLSRLSVSHMTKLKFDPEMPGSKKRLVIGNQRSLSHNHRTWRLTVSPKHRGLPLGKVPWKDLSRISSTQGRASRTLRTWLVRPCPMLAFKRPCDISQVVTPMSSKDEVWSWTSLKEGML